ncbi:MAG: OsmC family protein [Thermodesulfobacteriota bacterium]
MSINNVDLERLGQTVEAVRADPSKARKTNRIEGVWNAAPGPQFSATVTYEGGTMTFDADQPTFLGGGGRSPGAMLYCLFGSASCYAATFATVAASEGVELKRFTVTAESDIDFSKPLGLSDNPIAEGVRFTLHVESDAPEEKLAEIEEISKERCPAVYCLTQPIPLTTELAFG